MPPKKIKGAKKSLKVNSRTSPNVVSLNIDCLLMIFCHLTISERIKVERVCKLWQEAGRSGWVGFQSLDFKKSLWGFAFNTKVTITDKIIRTVLSRCGNYIREVKFPQFSNDPEILQLSISQRCLGTMWEMCPNMRILDLGFHRIRSSALSILANCSSNLEDFKLDLHSNISDDDLSTMFASNKKLKILHLFHNDSSNICKCVKDLPRNSIEEIMICNCHGTSTLEKIHGLFSSLLSVSPELQKFRKLSIHNITHNMSSWGLHSCAEGFNSVVLYSCTILCDKPTSNLLAFENLQELTFYGNRGDTDEFLIAVSVTCTKLNKLFLQACGSVTDRGLSAVALNLNLTKLEIIDMDNVCGKDLPKMHTLQYFRSENCRNLVEEYLAHMVLTAATDSRTFQLIHSYNDSQLSNRSYPPFNGKLLQAAAQVNGNHQNGYTITTQLCFQCRAKVGERKICIILDKQQKIVHPSKPRPKLKMNTDC
ncbi:uncharacterized protein LOC117170213 [Belonocnema kinseyi]|uniref:uncharacterized protein LOC117170213 n=1 Tax=Belonocnema kinseyi TaxID=2817044 RepID=UPI00143DE67B|nr:uncharacterized protein LOC117170213 [Belonocnema kinseyi]